MPDTICGTIERVYFAGPKFSAGLIETQDRKSVRFRGPFCANEGDLVTLIGLWMHYVHATKQPGFEGRSDLTWPAFVLAVAEDHPGYLTWFFRWTITRLIEPVDRLDLFLHFESLESEVSELMGVNVVLPPAYHGATCIDRWLADARLRGMAEAWGQADKLRFGY